MSFFLNFITSDDFIKKKFDYKEQISKKTVIFFLSLRSYHSEQISEKRYPKKQFLSLHISSHINREDQTSG